MNRILREPLLHFLLLGAALFVGYRLLNRAAPAGAQQIVVSPGQIEHMLATFVRTWQRPPAEDEVKGLIDAYVREEVLAREAMKLGLDQNDVIIRRRLQQKMEFIADDLSAAVTPDDAQLARYLAAHPDTFRQDQQFTFRQVYFNPEKHGDQLDADVARLLAELTAKGAGAETSELGDPSLLPPALVDEPLRGIENGFGGEFAAQLQQLPVGRWSGPVPSGVGMHLVLLDQRVAGRVPALAEVRDRVRREWESEHRREASRKLLEALLKQYEVTIH
jgi:PPIC-type PPIASE domain